MAKRSAYVRRATYEKVVRQRDWYKHLVEGLYGAIDASRLKDYLEDWEDPPAEWGGGPLWRS